MINQPNNQRFTQKIERIQYNVAIEIIGAIRGTSQIKSLKFSRCFRKLRTFLKRSIRILV